jgi:hypothetical protein
VRIASQVTGCSSVISAMVPSQLIPPMASISVVSPNTSCTEPNGVLTAVVNGPFANYQFEWFKGIAVGVLPVLSVHSTVTGLDKGTYSVLIVEKNTGCETLVSAVIMDECQALLSAMKRSEVQDSGISLYPNPTRSTLTIKHETMAGYVVLRDKNGKLLSRQNTAPSATLVDLSDQPAGRYILTFTSALGTSHYQIIKE